MLSLIKSAVDRLFFLVCPLLYSVTDYPLEIMLSFYDPGLIKFAKELEAECNTMFSYLFLPSYSCILFISNYSYCYAIIFSYSNNFKCYWLILSLTSEILNFYVSVK